MNIVDVPMEYYREYEDFSISIRTLLDFDNISE